MTSAVRPAPQLCVHNNTQQKRCEKDGEGLGMLSWGRWFSLSQFDKFTGSKSICCRLGQLLSHSTDQWLSTAKPQQQPWPIDLSQSQCTVTSGLKVLSVVLAQLSVTCLQLNCTWLLLVFVYISSVHECVCVCGEECYEYLLYWVGKLESDPHHEYFLYSTTKEYLIVCMCSSLEIDCTSVLCSLAVHWLEHLLIFANVSFHELDQIKEFKYCVPIIKMFHKLERLW